MQAAAIQETANAVAESLVRHTSQFIHHKHAAVSVSLVKHGQTLVTI